MNKSTKLLKNISNPRLQNVARLESKYLWNLWWLMQGTCVWFSLDMAPKQLVTSIKKISWAILPCHVDNGPVGYIFYFSTKYFGSMSTWQQFGCAWWVWCCVCDVYDLRLNSLMKPFHRSSEDSQVIKLHAS